MSKDGLVPVKTGAFKGHLWAEPSVEHLRELMRHTWPGNVRELQNAIEQAVVLSAGPEIEEADLHLADGPAVASEASADVAGLGFADAKKRTVEHFERGFLLAALRRNDGNISRTAESIGMVRQSLQQKIRELGLRSEDWNPKDS